MLVAGAPHRMHTMNFQPLPVASCLLPTHEMGEKLTKGQAKLALSFMRMPNMRMGHKMRIQYKTYKLLQQIEKAFGIQHLLRTAMELRCTQRCRAFHSLFF